MTYLLLALAAFYSVLLLAILVALGRDALAWLRCRRSGTGLDGSHFAQYAARRTVCKGNVCAVSGQP